MSKLFAKKRFWVPLIVVVVTMFKSFDVYSSDMLPAKVQSMLMFKVLGFEKRLKASAKTNLVLGVLYDADNAGSGEQKDSIVSAMGASAGKTVAGKHLDVKPITGIGDMADVDVVYVAVGNDDRLDKILEEAKKLTLLTVTGVPDYAEKGIALTLSIENKKPKIVINKAGADNCGVEFSSQILALAKVI